MLVPIEWINLVSPRDYWRCLYAYIHPINKNVLYIGKAYRCSVRERLKGNHKEDIYDYIIDTFNIDKFKVLVGFPIIDDDHRISEELVSDLESLLILRLKPPANIINRHTRSIVRPGLKINCEGVWPHNRKNFIDRA